MPARQHSIDTTLFALAVIKRIPREQTISAQELTDQLEEAGIDRNVRSVQRMLKVLSSHFDIDCDTDHRPHRYCWKPNAAAMLIPMVEQNEALMLLFAERFLANILPPGALPSFEGILKQAHDMLVNKQQSHGQWLDKVRVAHPTPLLYPPDVDPDVLRSVSECLFENRKLRLNYRNRRGELNDWVVLPLGLVTRAQVLYLISKFDDSDTHYRLALHRMVSVHPTTIRFAPPADFDIDQSIAEYGFSPGNRKVVKLEFYVDRRAGNHLTESLLSKDQVCTELEHEYHIAATVRDSIELRHWLCGFGDSIRDISIDGERVNINESRTWFGGDLE